MAVNYLMASGDDGQLPHHDGQLSLLVMTVNYLMASSDDGQLPHGF